MFFTKEFRLQSDGKSFHKFQPNVEALIFKTET